MLTKMLFGSYKLHRKYVVAFAKLAKYGGFGSFQGRLFGVGAMFFVWLWPVLGVKLRPRCHILSARTAVISEKSVYFAGCKNDVWP